MEHELLDEIRRFRKELNEAMGSLDVKVGDGRSFRNNLRGTQTELVLLREELARLQVKQAGCGCGCCAEGVRVYVDLEVSRRF